MYRIMMIALLLGLSGAVAAKPEKVAVQMDRQGSVADLDGERLGVVVRYQVGEHGRRVDRFGGGCPTDHLVTCRYQDLGVPVTPTGTDDLALGLLG